MGWGRVSNSLCVLWILILSEGTVLSARAADPSAAAMPCTRQTISQVLEFPSVDFPEVPRTSGSLRFSAAEELRLQSLARGQGARAAAARLRLFFAESQRTGPIPPRHKWPEPIAKIMRFRKHPDFLAALSHEDMLQLGGHGIYGLDPLKSRGGLGVALVTVREKRGWVAYRIQSPMGPESFEVFVSRDQVRIKGGGIYLNDPVKVLNARKPRIKLAEVFVEHMNQNTKWLLYHLQRLADGSVVVLNQNEERILRLP